MLRTVASLRRNPLVACCSAVAIAHAGLIGPAAAQDAPFTIQELAPGVFAAIDREGRSGANAGFVIGDEAVAVIDAFQYPEAAQRLLEEIRRRTPLPVKYLISTHYHIDHVAGNQVVKDAGALIVAHRNVVDWIRVENLKFFGPDQTKERALVGGLPLPDLIVDRELTIRLGARRLELRFLPGHSGGDVVIAVPDAGVLFAGDVFWRRVAPSLIDATVALWIETLDGLRQRQDASAYAYVPGQGGVATLADIGDFRNYLQALRDTVAAVMAAGAGGDDLVAAALPPLRAEYGDWVLFEDLTPQQVAFMAAELDGTKRLPPVQPGASW